MKIDRNSVMSLAVCVVAAITLVSPAYAEDEGWYLNFGAGVNLMSEEYHADPGFRLSLAGGYNFSRIFGLELETGFLYNSLGSENLSTSEYAGQFPVLLNAVLRYETDSKWVPYFGFGVGGAGLFDQTDDAGFDVVFQPKIGIRRYVSESISIGAGYRYLFFGAQSALTESLRGNHSIMFELNKTF